jgi:hypothetical protein
MAIDDNSYGSVAEVAALTLRYAGEGAAGTYDATTRPTEAQVEAFVDRVSGILNVLLAQAGFEIPVSQADAKLALDDFVVDHVVQLCHAANGSGPYAPGAESLRGRRPRQAILEEAYEFVDRFASGLELLGATRDRNLTDGLACREEDAAGDELMPFFDRHQMDNEVPEWDPD